MAILMRAASALALLWCSLPPSSAVQFAGLIKASVKEVPSKNAHRRGAASSADEAEEFVTIEVEGALVTKKKPSGEVPTEPGCYLRKLRGCPNHPEFNGTKWQRAMSSERLQNARLSRTACETKAKDLLAAWCGTTAIEALFVPGVSGMPTASMIAEPLPTEPGCFVRKLGCPSHPEFSGTGWKHAEHAEKFRNAKQNRTACEVDVKANLVDWCGTEHIEVHFVPVGAILPEEPLPTEPGCYIRKLGCPNHPEFSGRSWKHAENAERLRNAKTNRTACEVEVKAHLSDFCGTDAVEALFIPSLADILPTEPGCYIRKQRCPKHPKFNGTGWKHAEHAEKFRSAKLNRTACEVDVRANLTEWCGADVEVFFVPRTKAGLNVNKSKQQMVQEDPAGTQGDGIDDGDEVGTDIDLEEGLDDLDPQADAELEDDTEQIWVPDKILERANSQGAPGQAGNREYEEIVVAIDSEDGVEPTQIAREADSGLPNVVEPGCYVRKLQGCPKHPQFNGTTWGHAVNAERNTQAKTNRTACEVDVKASLKLWCGTEEIEVLFIPRVEHEDVLSSDGVEAAPASDAGNVEEVVGGEVVVDVDVEDQSDPPRTQHNVDTRIPKSDQSSAMEPGCYVRKLQGCPKHPQFNSSTWSHAVNAERTTQAKTNRTACEVDVRANLRVWCGTEDIEVLFIPLPELQDMPRGDLARDDGDDVEEVMVDVDVEAPSPPTQPQHQADLRIPKPNQNVMEPGCYVRKLQGCPKHPQLNGTSWGHAVNAERNTQAKTNRTACEVDVKASLKLWCGTQEIEVFFIPPMGPHEEVLRGDVANEVGAVRTEEAASGTAEPVDQAPEAEESGEEKKKEEQVDEVVDEERTGEEEAKKDVPQEDMESERVEHVEQEFDAKNTGDQERKEKQVDEAVDEKRTSEEEGKKDESQQDMESNDQDRKDKQVEEGGDVEKASEEEGKKGIPQSQMIGEDQETKEKQVDEVVDEERAVEEEEEEGKKDVSQGGMESDDQEAKEKQVGEVADEERTSDEEGKKDASPGDVESEDQGTKEKQLDEGGDVEKAREEEGVKDAPGDIESERAEHVNQEVDAGNTEDQERKDEQVDEGVDEEKTEDLVEQEGTADVNKRVARSEHVSDGEESSDEKAKESGTDEHQSNMPQEVDEVVVDAENHQEQEVEPPTEPGCWVRTPSGCPMHPSFKSFAWKHDEYAERYTAAPQNRSVCEITRKGHIVMWCGVDDVHMWFVEGDLEPPEAPPAAAAAAQPVPTEPGCYVRTPSGCPNHPSFGGEEWQHDAYAERFTAAKEDPAACEVHRKGHVQHWCGVQDAEMLFVPSAAGGRAAEPVPAAGDAVPTTGRVAAAEPEGTVSVPGNLNDPSHTDLLVRPNEPGCYVRTPGGCPNHPQFSSFEWKHEVYGERSTGATVNRTNCEVDRREHVAHWCGAPDVEVLFVSPPEPGCYVQLPSGCPRHPSFGGTTWKHEDYGENHANAKENRTECEITRRAHVASWCGTEDVRMRFIPLKQEMLIAAGQPVDHSSGPAAAGGLHAPSEPGCYVRTPTGCPMHPAFSSPEWKHEEYGERSTKAKESRVVCEIERKEHVSHWCGAEDVEALFVPAQAQEPGCYVRTPSGCPNHPSYASSTWKHEEYGEQHTDARVDRSVCMLSRRAHLQHWCGADDTEMLFVPEPTS